MADIVVKTHNGNETYTGIESVTFNTTQEGVKATFIAQKQADWLQNDETAVDYIKNKPFYENGDTVVKLDNKYLNILEQENVNENVILTQQNITDFAYNATFGAFWTIRYSILAELVEGQEYTVVWNGIEYVRTAFAFTNPTDGTSCIAVGNKMVSTGVDDGDRFAIVNDTTNNRTHLFSTEDKTEHSVAIYQAAAATYKINKTYLPDDIGKQSDWNQTDDTAVDFIKNKPENLATKTYVQEQIAAIDIPEAPEQVQSDWNESDETSKAFVQNRPFYVLGDWVKETTGTFAIDKYAKNNIRSSAVQYGSLSVEGDVFKVIWDGTEYECIATMQPVANFVSVGVIGNPKIIVEYYGNQVTASDTGEPFCFAQGFGAVYTRSAAASHTFRVYYKDNIVKLDEKFIPASVKLPSVTTDDNGKALIVTNGEWIASELEDETQADWNETDETSKAFILNKPEIPSIEGLATEDFVKEQIAAIEIPEGGGSGGSISTEKVIYAEDTWTTYYHSNYGAHVLGQNFSETVPVFPLALGDECVVVWDGEEYNVTVSDASSVMADALFVGNGSGYGLSGNNEPFCIAWTSEGVTFFAITDTEPTKHTVRIYQKMPLSVNWENVTDKPFGEEIATIFEGTFQDTLVDNDGDGVNNVWANEMIIKDTSEATLVIGETYTVIFEGVEYELKCLNLNGLPFIGNEGLITGTPDETPFLIIRDPYGVMGLGQCWGLSLIEPSTDLTISGAYDVKITGTVIKHLDNKYLDIFEGEEKPETEIFAEQTVEGFAKDGETYFAGMTASTIGFTVGATYHVVWDDVEYEFVAEITNGVSIGDAENYDPFLMVGTSEGLIIFTSDMTATSHKICIYQSATTETIKEKYIPIIAEEKLPIFESLGDKEIEIYPENTWSTQLDDNFGYAFARPFGEELPAFPLSIGDECIVVWDGEEYKVTVGDCSSFMPNTIFVGNGAAIGLSGNNEPFLIGWQSVGVTFAALTDTEPTEHTVRIYQKIKGNYKIKESYIPDSVKLPAATAEDNNKFLRIVNGIPTWVSLTDVSIEGA